MEISYTCTLKISIQEDLSLSVCKRENGCTSRSTGVFSFCAQGTTNETKTSVLCDEIGSARDGLLVGVTLLSSLLVNFCSLRFPFFYFSYTFIINRVSCFSLVCGLRCNLERVRGRALCLCAHAKALFISLSMLSLSLACVFT
jgi:hypothetical protein